MTADFMHLEDTVGLNVNGTSQMRERMAFTPDIKHVHVQMFTSVCPFRGKWIAQEIHKLTAALGGLLK